MRKKAKNAADAGTRDRALKIFYANSMSIARTADALGMNYSTLRNWVQADKKKGAVGSVVSLQITSQPVVVCPNGMRIEGLTPTQIAELLA